jgi:DNA modification methylase
MSKITLINDDCLVAMKGIPDESVDCVVTDPPYGSTACKWDTVIPFNRNIRLQVSRKERVLYEDEAVLELCKQGMSYQDAVRYFNENATDGIWESLKRITKKNGAIVLFGTEPFSSTLRSSNLASYKYDWYWNKNHGANFAQANKRPLNVIETISVFYQKPPTYNSQKIDNPKGEEKRHRYAPSKQKEVFVGQVAMANEYAKKGGEYEPEKLLARSIITFGREYRPVHPTQKPVALLEYLIRTYTNEGETVLDFTAGSFSTGVACLNTGRGFIGIEMDSTYFQVGKERMEKRAAELGIEIGPLS